MRTLQRTIFVLVVLLLIGGCSKDSSFVPTDNDLEFLAETAGNNLSFPVIWTSEIDKKLTPLGNFGEELWEGAEGLVGTTVVWLQKDPLNQWQASTFTPKFDAHPEWVDWGDNLESKPWSNKSIVRTEVSFQATGDLLNTSVYTHIPGNELTTRTYEMLHVSGQGTDEVWGATKTHNPSETAMVYTHLGKLVIQRLADTFEEVEEYEEENPTGYNWNTTTGEWDDAENPKVQAPYTAEINVQGKVVFGYNWNMKKSYYEPGIYRITFYTTDPKFILRHAQQLVQIEATESEGGEGGKVTVDGDLNITYIDVKIIAASGGGGGGGGNGPGGGGGGGGGNGPGGPH